jgi:hypothetical protein
VYLGESVGVNPAQPNTCAPLNPGQTSVASGDINVFGIAAPGQTVAVNVYRGLMSFFQPLSQLVIAGPAAGIFLYSPTPGLGNLIGSWSSVPGVDEYGNVYPSGLLLQADPTNSATGILTVQDSNGNALLTIDGSGDINGVNANFQSLSINGLDLFNDILNPMPQGVLNRGWTPTPPWPSGAIGTGDTAILELDQVIPAGRQVQLELLPADIVFTTAPAGVTQVVHHIRYTSDGSTPTTTSPEFSGHSPMVMTIPVTNLLNYITPYKSLYMPVPVSDTLYRMLVTASTQSGAFKYQTFLEMVFTDKGANAGQFGNSGVSFGTGGSGGGGSQQTYTKSYVAVEFASYYGDHATYGGGANSQRSHNASSNYQGCASGYDGLSGDQYSFARFNYGQIATDLGAGVINWVKLRITNQHFWYNGGGNAIIGWTTYTGAWGSTFVPGGGTHMAAEVYHVNEGATVTRTMGAWLKSAITSGFTSIMHGTSASYTNRTDLNNYSYWAAAGNTSTAPQLTINYTK